MKFIKILSSLLVLMASLMRAECPIVLYGVQSTNVTCYGGFDGTVTVSASGGVDPLQYSIDGGGSYYSSPLFTNFSAGNYTLNVTVTDGVCTSTSGSYNITLTQPASALIISTTATNVTVCYGNANGSIIITTTGGTPGYQYSLDGINWVPSSTTSDMSWTFSTLSGGTYPVAVRDAHFCSTSTTVTLTQPAQIVISNVATTHISCNNLNDGSIGITASGGTGALIYSIDGGVSYYASGIFTGLGADTYTVQVQDANSCVATYSGNPITFVNPTSPTITGVVSTNVTCFAGNDGTITVTGYSGGIPPYTFALNDLGYQSSPTFTGLAIGAYYVDIKDVNLCETSYAGNPVVISQPTKIVFDVSEVGACGPFPAQGFIIISDVIGGTPGYQYSIDNGITWLPSSTTSATTYTFDVAPGTYDIAVRDSYGCVVTYPFNSIIIDRMTASIAAFSPVTCYTGNNGTITVSAAGGIAPYVYSISSTPTSSSSFGPASSSITGLAAGTYVVRVTDAVGQCFIDNTVTITQPAPVTVDVAYTYSTSGCDIVDATITMTVYGGTQNYQFSIDGGTTWQPTSSTPSSTYTYTGLSQGIYFVKVRYGMDAHTCELSYPSNPIVINDNGGTFYTVSTTNVSPCYGNSNGSITINVTSGTGPFQYSIDGGLHYTSSHIFTGLNAGSYEVKVTASETAACTSNAYVTISQPAELAFSVLTYDACNSIGGSIEFSYPSGGTPPYEYYINYGATSSANPQFLNLAPGDYSGLYMTDAFNCTSPVYTSTLTIGNVTLVITQSQDVTCYGGSDGSFTFTTEGSVTPYRYSINGGDTWSDLYTTTLSGLPAGSYRIAVKNSAGTCRVQASVVINQPGIVQLTATRTNPSCYASSDGSILIKARGGTPPYEYSITGSSGTFYSSPDSSYTFTGLPVGTYEAYVKDAHECFPSTGIPIILTQPTPVTISFVTATNILCHGQNTGSIVIGASGGTGLLQFSITGSSGSYYPSNAFTGLVAGTYPIAVKDANFCITTSTVSLTQPTQLVITDVTSSPIELCWGDNSGSITISLADGTPPYQYSINGGTSWSPATMNTTYTFSNLYAGTYTIAALDYNLCTTTYDQTITLTQPPQLLISNVFVTSVTGCNSNTNGSIEIITAGGTPGYQYSIDAGSTWVPSYTTSDMSWTFTNLGINSSGSKNYTVAVRDSNNCQKERTVTLTGPSLIVVTATKTNITCHDLNDGIVVVHATGGTPAYEYELTSSFVTYPYQSLSTFTGLLAGAYTPYVRDANGCIEYGSTVTIVNPAELKITGTTQINVLCNGASTGQIVVTATGGTGALKYSKSGIGGPFQSSNTFSGLTTGTYYICVEDVNLCQTPTIAMYISQPADPLTISVTSTNVTICYGNTNGSIGITTSGGTPGYQYSINNGSSWSPTYTTADMSWTFTNLGAGTYRAVVRDANHCIKSFGSVTLTSPTEIIVTTTKTNISCYNNNDGAITISASHGTPGYQYSITGSTSWVPTYTTNASWTFTDLAGGSYIPYVQDANGCVVAGTAVTIVNPAPITISSIPITNVLCYGTNTGKIIINALGGTAPLSYSINGTSGHYQFSNTFTGLATGTYDIAVEDVHLCPTATASVYISQPAAPVSVTASSTNITCHGLNDGTIILSASGGTGTYNYSITGTSGHYQLSNTFTGLSAGTYATEVKDTNSCQASGPIVTIVNPQSLAISGITTTNVTCFGGDDASIVITATGGTGALSYSINGTSGLFQSSNTFSNLITGTYHIAIKDANDCMATYATPTVITQPAPITISSIPITNVLCYGANTGKIIINALGGTAPLSYSINGTSGHYQLSNTFTGLATGTYDVAVEDVHLCPTATASVYISQPAAPVSVTASSTNITCHGLNDGTIILSASGGTGTYNYSITGTSGHYQLSNTFTGLSAGTYATEVKDTNSCQASGPIVTIVNPESLAISGITTTNVTCFGGDDASIVITATGGTGALSYSINGTSGLFQSSNTFSNLITGTYHIAIKDANGCMATYATPVVITQPAPITISGITTTNVLCYGANTGKIIINALGGTAPLSYSINGTSGHYQFSNTFTGLSAGTYDIAVEDVHFCPTATASVYISQPAAPVSVTASSTNITCHGLTDGTITLSATGGTGVYNYSINGGSSYQPSNLFTGLPAGTYATEVKDTNSCQASGPIVTIVNPQSLAISGITTTNVTCFGGDDASIVITATGGTGALSYSINGTSGSFQSSNTFSNLSSGTYHLAIKDANDCMATYATPVVITQPELIVVLGITTTDVTCFGGANASIVITATGGTGALSYSIHGQSGSFQSSNIFNNLSAETYNIAIKDANACMVTYPMPVVITQPAPIDITITNKKQPVCPTDNGSFTVTVTGGTPYYTIFLNNIQTATTSNQVNLIVEPGTYNLSVTDTRGCIKAYSPAIIIDEPPTFFITTTHTDESTCDNIDATITTSVIGGQALFTYYLEGPLSTTTVGPISDLSHIFKDLIPGVYTTYVVDGRGCTSNEVMLAISVKDLDFTISLSVTDVSCFGFDDGSITINAFDTDSTHASFAYSIDNGLTFTSDGTSYTFDNLFADTYDIVVKDLIDHCETSTFVTLTQPPQLHLTITHTQSPLCFGYTTSMAFQASGGVPPYDAYLDGNLVATDIAPNVPTTITVTVGDHTLEIRDQIPCGTSLTFTIVGPDQVNFTTTFSNVRCNDASDGSITMYATGGNGQYNYFVNGSLYGPAPSPYTISNLTTGTYTITVEDTNQCPASSSQTIYITQPQPVACAIISIKAPTFVADGSVTVSFSGGTPPYTATCFGQQQQAGENEPITFYLPTGTYQLTVYDSNGCCPPLRRINEEIMKGQQECHIFMITIPEAQRLSNARCCKICNRFSLCADLVNVVSWSSYAGAVGYVVSSDSRHVDVLAFVRSSQPLVYSRHCCTPGVTNTYYIFAINENGDYSQPAIVTS